mmetsp:Transcript_15459/g.31725  ORF Transcript_15459/g.31725 Transcript_15459/m.31725 type:complete len:93 (-) Transcript_15459:700-978(-)
MQNLTKLEEFVLENNDVSGSIPTEIGYLTSLKLLNLRGNSFTGEIPSEIGQLTNLREILLGTSPFPLMYCLTLCSDWREHFTLNETEFPWIF